MRNLRESIPRGEAAHLVQEVARYARPSVVWAAIAAALAALPCLLAALDSTYHPAWRVAGLVAALSWAYVSVTSVIKAVTLTIILHMLLPPPAPPTQETPPSPTTDLSRPIRKDYR